MAVTMILIVVFGIQKIKNMFLYVYEEHDADFYCELKLCFQEENLDYSFSVESVTCDIKLDQDSRVERLVQDPEENAKADQMDGLEEYYRH